VIRRWLIVAILAVSCGPVPKPITSPEGTAAYRARQVIAAAEVVLTSIDALVTLKRLQPADAAVVVRVIQRIGKETQVLANILQLADQAPTQVVKDSHLKDAGGHLQLIQTLLAYVTIGAIDGPAQTDVQDSLRPLSAALTNLMAVLPARGTP
jgi:hypothetical protein